MTVSKHLIDYLDKNYDIGKIRNAEKALDGHNSETILIITDDSKYILKIYPPKRYHIRTSDDYRYELDFLNYLSDHHVPVPRSVKRKDGQLLSCYASQNIRKEFALFKFIEGRAHGGWTDENGKLTDSLEVSEIEGLGQTVALMHQLSDTFHSPYHRYHLDLDYIFDDPLNMLALEVGDEGQDIIQPFRAFAQPLKEKMINLGKQTPQYGLIHADLCIANILYDPHIGYSIIDFDYCGFGWRPYDLSTFTQNIKIELGLLSDPVCSAFLKGYENVRPLSWLEKECILLCETYFLPLWGYGDALKKASVGADNADLWLDNSSSDTKEGFVKEALERVALFRPLYV